MEDKYANYSAIVNNDHPPLKIMNIMHDNLTFTQLPVMVNNENSGKESDLMSGSLDKKLLWKDSTEIFQISKCTTRLICHK